MRELTRSNDVVFLSWLEAALKAEGIAALVLDAHTSIVEGSIGAIQRRIVVAEEDFAQASAFLAAAREDGLH